MCKNLNIGIVLFLIIGLVMSGCIRKLNLYQGDKDEDENKDNGVKAIEKNDLDWGHVSSLKGWSCPVAKLYNVSGVPAMLLIDKEGKIVATKLRGDLLMEKVAEQFGE